MKKHGLLKILGILLLLVVIVTYFVKGGTGAIDQIGLIDVILNSFKTIFYFFHIPLFILAVGGFYGVLSKTPAYKKLLDNIVLKVKPLGKKFIFITIILFAIISSFTGMTLPLMIFVPFVVTIILLLGYDKLVALTTTVVSIIIGSIGGIFTAFMNPNTGAINTYETFVGLESKFANTFPKLLLLFAGITLLIYFINNHIKNVEKKKVNYELSENSDLLINEVKGDYKSIKTWPIIVILALLFVILTLGMFPWNGLFKIEVFQDFHKWLMELSIKEFVIIPTIFTADIPAFGEWLSAGDSLVYMIITILLLFASLLVALFNRIKLNDMIDGFVEGMKKFLPAAALTIVAYTILYCVVTHGFLQTIITDYGKFNYGISTLLALLGCLVNIDTYYVVVGAFAPILNLITDESVYASVAILFQSIYGVFNIVGPTSIILIFALSYMDVPYTTWLKYIWRFVLSLIVLVALVLLLVILL